MTWNDVHSRGEILRTVSAAADHRRDGRLPLDIAGVGEVFEDELELLGVLQLRWHTRLSGHIERQLMHQPLDLEAAVIAAWHATADELPGIRAILDRHREHPLDDAMAEAMRTATDKEHILLAVMAGRAGTADSGAAPVGARIEDKARATYRPAPRYGTSHGATRLLDRLKAVLAA